MMSDVVFIKNLQINTVIGVYEWERAICQPLLVSAKMTTDITKAGNSDDVEDVINYKMVCQDIQRLCQQLQPKLLEYLAEQLCAHILANYPCQSVTLTLEKPHAITPAQSVGIKITRHQSPTDDTN